MFENEKDFVTEEVAENVENTTEQTPKTYTEAEFNAKLDEVLGKKIARREAKIRKEYDREYGELVETLKVGTGKQSVSEINDAFKEFYASRGIKMPEKPQYSAKDIEVLARADADEIIHSGYEDVVEEVDRLAELGTANMTDKEKAVFKILAEHRNATERSRELTEIGVTEDVYNSTEFKDFQSKFASSTPIKDIYDIYKKTQPKKEFKTMGSVKNNTSDDAGVKDYYSPEEARRFTEKDLREHPEIEAAILNSMPKWK